MRRYLWIICILAPFLTGSDCNSTANCPDTQVSCPDTQPNTCPDIPTSTKVTLTKDWKTNVCGGYDLKINKYDGERGWIYLATRKESVIRYSDALPFRGRKSERGALYLGHKVFVGLEDCREQSCTATCQVVYVE